MPPRGWLLVTITPLPMRLLAILVSGCLAAPALGTTFVRISDADLADSAPVIAEVRVVAWEMADAAGLPATDYLVEVERLLKGEPGGSTLVVRVPGGFGLDGVAWEVQGAPRFHEGERALLFLVPGQDGTWAIHQLMLGAFHRVDAADDPLALRDLDGAHEVVLQPSTPPEEGADGHRSFEGFASWLQDRAQGQQRPADYFVAADDGTIAVYEQYSHMTNQPGQCGDGLVLPIRWFSFDSGGQAVWRADPAGQPGMTGGGFTEFQNALAAWTDDGGSTIRLAYGGKGTTGDGTIKFDDPDNQISGSFSCSSGGVLAIGGPSFYCNNKTYAGTSYREAVRGFVVTQDGAGCFFGGNGGKNGEEVFGHELGHTLGFGHSTVSGALMRSTAYGDGRGAKLGTDDRNAAAFVYGDGDSGGGDDGGGGGSAPLAPSSLSATTLSSSEIRLTWSDRSSDESRFEVERSTGGSFSRIATLGANVTKLDVTGLAASTQYTFRVRACNSVGCSSYSNQATATTSAAPTKPSAPTSLSASAVSESQIQLTWKDTSSDESSFRIERSTSGGPFGLLAITGAGATSYLVGGLAATTSYAFRVQACNAAGCSSFSNLASATTKASSATLPPSTPTSFAAWPISMTQAKLSWGGSSTATSYRFERAAGSGAFIATYPSASGTREVLVDGLAGGTPYSFRMQACNAAGCSPYSAVAEINTFGGASTSTWLYHPNVPGFELQARFQGEGGATIQGALNPVCIPETLCVSGAVAGRSELFLRVVGPKPNGYQWPTLVKFSTSEVEVSVRRQATGEVRTYRLDAAAPGYDTLPGLFDRAGFWSQFPGEANSEAVAGATWPTPPSGSWLWDSSVPGFRFKVRVSNQLGQVQEVRLEGQCIEETACLSAAVPGRSELFLRVVGPKPNGFLWPTLVRFTTSNVEVWLEQVGTGIRRYYLLPGARIDRDRIDGLFDRYSFPP
ncbi:MAG TPA: fibronectin type III domain-containing protein [Thermoanaerobaculia bacterium]|nr:fibronectin type III domain-containing protein [Thermoanaerobaculia bacterium]